MLVNCDIGERGPANAADRKLMEFIQIANLACGGHAGDKKSVKAFGALAAERGVKLAAHLSYPDRGHFGRKVMRIPEAALLASLAKQLALIPGVRCVKLHGALYHEACHDHKLAEALAQWLKISGIHELLAPVDSEIAVSAEKRGIKVLNEAFVERRYGYDKAKKKLVLVDRSRPGASIDSLEEAAAQAAEIIQRRRVNVNLAKAGRPVWKKLEADTVCIHSDSPIALELAARLRLLTKSVEQNYRLLSPGICETAGLPRYGSQDQAISPGGAMDNFSLKRGNLALGNPPETPALEILAAPEIEILVPGRFILTGARRPVQIQSGKTVREAGHSRVCAVQPGERVTFGEKQYGLRTYFCFRPLPENGEVPGAAPEVSFSDMGGWTDPQGRIRVLPGPEYGYLENPELFFGNTWRTTFQMDKMGMHLAGEPRLKCGLANMVSEAVADGTVQLTPEGPIILLRHRQTTGGYPRIFNVITADIDLLGQYGPSQVIRFARVTREEARGIFLRKEKVLARLNPRLKKRA